MVLSLRTGRMELSLTETEKMIIKSKSGRNIRSLPFEYIDLEIPVRNLRRNVHQAGDTMVPARDINKGVISIEKALRCDEII